MRINAKGSADQQKTGTNPAQQLLQGHDSHWISLSLVFSGYADIFLKYIYEKWAINT